MLTPEDIEFGKKAFTLGLVNEERVRYCVEAQKTLFAQGKIVTLLQTMLHFQLLSTEQALYIQKSIALGPVPDNAEKIQKVQKEADRVLGEKRGSLTPEQRLSVRKDTSRITRKRVEESFVQEVEESFVQEVEESFVQEIEESFVQEVEEADNSFAFTSRKTPHGETKFNRYVLQKELRKGVVEVHEAYDVDLDRTIALKMISIGETNEKDTQRFLREARTTGKLRHFNIVTVYDIGLDEEYFFFTMDYLQGGSLKDFIYKTDFEIALFLDIMIKVIRGVAYAHEQGVIHRDLKPSNILFDQNLEPKVVDFGLVKLAAMSSKLSRSGAFTGTLQYMPPEQAEGSSKVDKTYDTYSLGVILYEGLTQRLPFDSKNFRSLLNQIQKEEAIPPHEINEKIPLELSHICLKAMAKNTEDRYLDAGKLIEDLEKLRSIRYSSPSTSPTLFAESASPSEIKTISDGEKFGHYRILAKLGEGGMGSVYRAFDENLARDVALKIILPQEGETENQIQRFMEEASATATLKHPNIVSVYEIGNKPQNYFTMECIEGEPLSSILREKNLSPKKIAKILLKCSQAIHYAHEHGIIHRDIKPANIMMEKNVEPKVMDFGLAKNLENKKDLSQEGNLLGTPVYMSPEQAEGRKVDARSDVYSLGATLYEMLSLRPPFQGESLLRLLNQIFHEDPITLRTLNPDTPKDLEAICLKCLEKRTRKRYQTAQELADDLENFLHSRPIQAKPINGFVRFSKWFNRNKTIASIAFISLFLVSCLLGLAIWQGLEKNEIKKQESARQDEAKDKEEEVLKDIEGIREGKKEALEAVLKLNATAKILREKAEITSYRASIALARKYNDDSRLKEALAVLEQCRKNLKGWEWYWEKKRGLSEGKTHLARSNDLGTKSYLATFHPNGEQIAIGPTEGIKLIKSKDLRPELYISEQQGKIFGRYSADGTRLVTVGADQRMFIWDTLTGEKIKSWDINFRVDACNIHSDYEKELFCASGNKGRALILDLKTEEVIRNYSLNQKDLFPEIKNHGELHGCAFSHDGETLVLRRTGKLEDKNGFMYFINWKSTPPRKWMWKTPTYVSSMACHPHQSIIAVSLRSKIVLCDMNQEKLKPLKELNGYFRSNYSCSFSPDGKRFLAGGDDKTIYLWMLEEDKPKITPILVLKGHTRKVLQCSFSKQGDKILSLGEDNTIRLWDTSE